MSLPFDTLEYAKKLEAAGVPSAQAQLQSKLLADLLGRVTVSPGDLQSFERDLSSRIDAWERSFGGSTKNSEGNPLAPEVGFDALKRGFTHLKWMLATHLVINSAIFLTGR